MSSVKDVFEKTGKEVLKALLSEVIIPLFEIYLRRHTYKDFKYAYKHGIGLFEAINKFFPELKPVVKASIKIARRYRNTVMKYWDNDRIVSEVCSRLYSEGFYLTDDEVEFIYKEVERVRRIIAGEEELPL